MTEPCEAAGRGECVQAVLVKYAGTKREHRRPLIMPVTPWCETHDLPMAMCALRTTLAERTRERDKAQAIATSELVKAITAEARAESAESKLAEARLFIFNWMKTLRNSPDPILMEERYEMATEFQAFLDSKSSAGTVAPRPLTNASTSSKREERESGSRQAEDKPAAPREGGT